MTLGADICCDSAHKTLPVLTGGAYLHVGKNAPELVFDMAEQAMALFSSTSPSYLIMQSLDMANLYISEGYAQHLAALVKKIDNLKKKLTEKGFCIVGDERLKLSVAPKSYGYMGEELAEILLSKNIVCEFADRDFLVMMFTPEVSDQELYKLEKALLEIEKREAITEIAPVPTSAETVLTVRDAMLSPSCEMEIENSLGRILASASVSCPPAIPILISGERIDKDAIRCFEYYGIEKIRVVK